jgi:hypothetical protein
MTDPYATPTSELAVPVKTDKEVELIRMGQKLVIYAILLNIGVAILAQFVSLLGFLQIGVLAVSMFGLVKQFQGFQVAMWARVLIILSMVIPLVNLLVLLRLNARATKALRAAGYRVGLMGASARTA